MPHHPPNSSLPAEPLLARTLRTLSNLYVKTYHSAHATNPSPIPTSGPAIIAPNHTSALDPLILEYLIQRPVCWMMAREYFGPRLLSPAWNALHVIPVARNGRDATATRHAIRALNQGRVLGIFPEGKISPTNQLEPLHPGVALLASKLQLPIYPIRIDGTQHGQGMLECFLKPNQITATFHSPISGTHNEIMSQLTQSLAPPPNLRT